MALSSEGLAETLGLTGDKKLSQEELLFTEELSQFLSFWSDKAGKSIRRNSKVSAGLVIGLTASQIIANVLLHAWDQSVKEKLNPIFYGRYVDDMFIVIRDPGNIHSIKDFMALLVERLGTDYLYPTSDASESPAWEIQQGPEIQGKSKISFQPKKQKLFILSGQNGLDLLANIEKDIQELSSEHRLMSAPDDFQNSSAVKVLSAVSNTGESTDTLRRTDGLTIQRLGLTLQLKHIETLACYLPKNEWENERHEFYDFVRNHLLCTTNLFTNYRYLPRILGISVSLGEWKETSCIMECIFDSLEQLLGHSSDQTITINGIDVSVKEKKNIFVLNHLKEVFSWLCFDVITRYDVEFYTIPLNKKSPQRSKLEAKLNNYLPYENLESLESYSASVLIADLSFKPYKEIWKNQSILNHLKNKLKDRKHIRNGSFSGRLLGKKSTGILDLKYLKDFLIERGENRRLESNIEAVSHESILPYLFPTRPYTPAEIAEIDPECINNAELWRQYTKTLRGTWVQSQPLDSEKTSRPSDDDSQHQYMVGSMKKSRVTIALSNFKTDDQDWSEMADNKSKLRLERYQRIAELVNQAIKLDPKPDYLVFPELSIPKRWIDCIANKLMTSGISLIAGTEYHHHSEKKIFSEACLVLADDRLGYPSWIKIWQPKLEPAVQEEKDLISKFGKSWECLPKNSLSKPTYNHNGFHFGVMVCSELQNSKSRIEFQGKIDALFVLAWNQDLETFSSLVEAASLDIHAYTILVNNRTYGDSRVRSPAKQSFKRDLARVRGGENDFIVSVTIDIADLRAFQSREKRWPEETDEFKPVPEGYTISKSRKTTPSL